MGSFSIWHWLILAAIVGVPIWLVVRATRKAKENAPPGTAGPVGIGGWLALLAFGQTIGPLVMLADLVKDVDQFDTLLKSSSLPNLALAEKLEVGLMLCLAAYQVAVAVAMYRKKSYFPTLFLWQWIAVLLVSASDLFAPFWMTGLTMPQDVATQALGNLGAILVGEGIWVLYVFRSVRVRNTFVN
jgi:uncharacterized membrane protein